MTKRHKTLSLCVLLFVINGTGLAVQDLSGLFEQVRSSVVLVKTQGTLETPGRMGPPMTTEGTGSGVLIAANRVLTSAHVVQAEDFVVVHFIHGEDIEAKVLSSSVLPDVALLELREKPKGVTPAKIGNSDETKVGEPVMLVGAPFNMPYTLSTGHISNRVTAKKIGRGLTEIEHFQTDASINRGNSGGPMFNMKGELIGIVSGMLTESGGFEGFGFAVTSSVIKEILLEVGHVWTGIEGQFIGEPMTEMLNVPQANGILIQRVAMDSLGSRLGLRPGVYPATIGGEQLKLGGDIVLEVLGQPFEGWKSLTHFRRAFAGLRKGATIQVVVWRHGERVVLSCKR